MNQHLPAIRCTGYPLPYEEAAYWYRTLHGKRKLWPIFGLMAMASIASDAWVILLLNSRALGSFGFLALGLLFICSISALTSTYKLFRAVKVQQLFRPYAMYANDRERHRFGTEMTVYGDRVETRSLRSTVTVRFADVQWCVETEKGFALTDGVHCILFRAADITPALAASLRERFFTAIDHKRMHRASTVRPHRAIPLPLMNVPTMPSPPVTATVTQTFDGGEQKRISRLCASFSASLGGVAGVMLGCLLTLTPWPLWDIVLLCVGTAAVMWLVTFVLMAYYRIPPKKDLPFAEIYADGLRVTAEGVTQFYPKNFVTITVANGGVYMKVFNQQTLFIPFDAADDAEKLKQLLGVDENGK